MPDPPEPGDLPTLTQGRDLSKPFPPWSIHTPFFVISAELSLQPLLSTSAGAGETPCALIAGASVTAFQRHVWSWGITGAKPVRGGLTTVLSPLWEPHPAQQGHVFPQHCL